MRGIVKVVEKATGFFNNLLVPVLQRKPGFSEIFILLTFGAFLKTVPLHRMKRHRLCTAN